jgi:hypothetical protein
MNRQPDRVASQHPLVLRLEQTLNAEEAILLRALAAGQTGREVCKQLRMGPAVFLRMMREMREKSGAADNACLIAWAKRVIKGVDQRLDRPEKYARLA